MALQVEGVRCRQHVNPLKQALQEQLAAQGALLEQTQASLQECQRQSTRIEARAALREERQRSIIARLQEGHTCMSAEVSLPTLLPPERGPQGPLTAPMQLLRGYIHLCTALARADHVAQLWAAKRWPTT